MRQLLTLLLATLLPVSVHAQPVVVVHADFNDDIVGDPPDTSLPGGPEGDAMRLSTGPPGGSFTVVAASGPLTDQPLEANRVAGPGGFNCVFDFPAAAYPCRSFIIKWCSVARTGIPTKFFVLRGTGVVLGSVNYRPDGITLSVPAGEQTVGTWAIDAANCFEWHVDLSVPSQTLFIDGIPVAVDVEGLSSLEGNVLSFSYEASLQQAFTFAIDDVEVSADNCPVPITRTSWGAVKATYR